MVRESASVVLEQGVSKTSSLILFFSPTRLRSRVLTTTIASVRNVRFFKHMSKALDHTWRKVVSMMAGLHQSRLVVVGAMEQWDILGLRHTLLVLNRHQKRMVMAG